MGIKLSTDEISVSIHVVRTNAWLTLHCSVQWGVNRHIA